MRMIIIYKSEPATAVSVRGGDAAALEGEAAMPSPAAGDTPLTHAFQPGQFNSLNNYLTEQ
ncbi:hypothetical protein [Burkholderia pyrrocinia]|uniref:hypothetical protein n=1 Tax=Burkholderia pyrrocinia TaxID=60550 RepID=UPI00130E8629|nr:hypothetical protein [Burkholderia pyrrocinia]